MELILSDSNLFKLAELKALKNQAKVDKSQLAYTFDKNNPQKHSDCS